MSPNLCAFAKYTITAVFVLFSSDKTHSYNSTKFYVMSSKILGKLTFELVEL